MKYVSSLAVKRARCQLQRHRGLSLWMVVCSLMSAQHLWDKDLQARGLASPFSVHSQYTLHSSQRAAGASGCVLPPHAACLLPHLPYARKALPSLPCWPGYLPPQGQPALPPGGSFPDPPPSLHSPLWKLLVVLVTVYLTVFFLPAFPSGS